MPFYEDNFPSMSRLGPSQSNPLQDLLNLIQRPIPQTPTMQRLGPPQTNPLMDLVNLVTQGKTPSQTRPTPATNRLAGVIPPGPPGSPPAGPPQPTEGPNLLSAITGGVAPQWVGPHVPSQQQRDLAELYNRLIAAGQTPTGILGDRGITAQPEDLVNLIYGEQRFPQAPIAGDPQQLMQQALDGLRAQVAKGNVPELPDNERGREPGQVTVPEREAITLAPNTPASKQAEADAKAKGATLPKIDLKALPLPAQQAIVTDARTQATQRGVDLSDQTDDEIIDMLNELYNQEAQ